MGSRLVNDIWNGITSNAIRVEVHINADEKDYNFHLVDDRTGKEIGRIRETGKPVVGCYVNNDLYGNIQAVLEAPIPQ
jgi:hypothetical protein